MQDHSQNSASGQERATAASWAIKLVWKASHNPVIGMLIFTLVRGVAPAGFIIAIRGLINSATEQMNLAQSDFSVLLPWLVIALCVTLTDGLAALAHRYFSERLKGDLTLHVNDQVLRHASCLDLPYFEDKNNREILGRVQQDPGAKLHHFISSGQVMLLAAFQAVSLMAVLIWLEPTILLAVVFLALPFFFFEWRLASQRYQTEYHRTKKRRWTQYFLSLLTLPQAAGEVKLLGIGELLARRFFTTMHEFREQDRRLQLKQFIGGTVFTVLSTLAFYALFARVGYRVIQGELTIGDLAVFGGAIARLRVSLDIGIRSASTCFEQTLHITDLREFLLSRPVVPDTGQRDVSEKHGALSVENICFKYPGTDQIVLRDLTFSLVPGETVAIVGENGSGKSTLAKVLARLYDVDSGVILLDGCPVSEYPIETLHKRIALLGQNYGCYEASFAENIAYGNWSQLSKDREAIESIASLTGIDRLAEEMPDGLDTPLGRQFAEHDLSGGQWQRLAIARTLAKNASLLILDEPTSNIDARAENDLFTAIAGVVKEVTTIIISHRFSTLRMADRILVMHQGSIVEQGSHDELIDADGRYANLYRLHEHYRIQADG